MYKLPQVITTLADSVSNLPSIGPKSALKITLGLLDNADKLKSLRNGIEELSKALPDKCINCGLYVDKGLSLCSICEDDQREDVIMIVETAWDTITVEQSNIYKGKYLVLGGLISPIRGLSWSDLAHQLVEDVLVTRNPREIIIGLPSSIEGETTSLFINQQLQQILPNIPVSILAKGMPSGIALENLDPLTVANAIRNKHPI